MSRSRAALLAAGAALVVPAAAHAQTESRASADVSATVGYSNNPFATTGGDTGAVVVTEDIAPRYELLTPHSVFTLSADIDLQQYLRRYGDNENFAAAVDYSGRPSARVTTHARVDVSSAVLGSFFNDAPLASGFGGIAATGVAVTDPGTPATTTTTGTGTGTGTVATVPVLPSTSIAALSPFTDIGLFGLRNRRNLARASGDLGVGLSARDSVTVSGFAEVARYDDLAAGDYEDYGGSVGYSRLISDRLSVGLRGSGAVTDYRVGDADSQYYSIEATASGQLSQRWSASGSLGVSFVNSNALGSTHSTSLSGSANLCRRGERTNMCLVVIRQVSPTGLAGDQYVTSAGLSWNRRIDERQNVSLTANYSRVGGDDVRLITNNLPLQTDYLQVVGGYGRRLGNRLRLVASAYYRQLLGGDAGRPADVGGQVGLSYRIGDRR